MRDFNAEYEALITAREAELKANVEAFGALHGGLEGTIALATIGALLITKHLADSGMVHACRQHTQEIEETSHRLFSHLLASARLIWCEATGTEDDLQFALRLTKFCHAESLLEQALDLKIDALEEAQANLEDPQHQDKVVGSPGSRFH